MSQNKTLKPNDLVRYLGGNADLDLYGFVQGQFYLVRTNAESLELNVKANEMHHVDLTDDNGFNDYALHFAKHACPIVLPRGV